MMHDAHTSNAKGCVEPSEELWTKTNTPTNVRLAPLAMLNLQNSLNAPSERRGQRKRNSQPYLGTLAIMFSVFCFLMVRNNVKNLAPQEKAAQKTTSPVSTTTDTNSEFVARDEASDHQQAIQEGTIRSVARSTDSSDSTAVVTTPNTPIRQISILGERNSGTRWTFE